MRKIKVHQQIYLTLLIMCYDMPVMIRDTIKKHDDFIAGENDQTARCAYFLIRAKITKWPDAPRYGLIVTKKTFKHAVDRNRAKRMLRDDWDYVFVARRDILGATRTDGRVAMKKALNYLRKQNIDAK